MRLINVKTLRLREFNGEVGNGIPPYATLSHTWGDDEVTFQDLHEDDGRRARTKTAAYAKITGTCAKAQADGIEWAWIDTCCIDKSSSTELSEAINSMFQWYAMSDICYAYLSDVSYDYSTLLFASQFPDSFTTLLSKSRWFTRGWTLQELLAPQEVVFFDRDWHEFGSKHTLCKALARITNISPDALTEVYAYAENDDGGGGGGLGQRAWDRYSVAQKFSWAADRETSRPEDEAYCLLGLFGVNMPLLYGEGRKAFMRLQEEIIRRSGDQSIFAWSRPSDQHSRWNTSGMLAPSPHLFRQASGVDVVVRHEATSLTSDTHRQGEIDDMDGKEPDKREPDDSNQPGESEGSMPPLDFMHELMQTWMEAYMNPFELIRNTAVIRQPVLGPLNGMYLESMADSETADPGLACVTAIKPAQRNEFYTAPTSMAPIPQEGLERGRPKKNTRDEEQMRRPASPIRYKYEPTVLKETRPRVTLTPPPPNNYDDSHSLDSRLRMGPRLATDLLVLSMDDEIISIGKEESILRRMAEQKRKERQQQREQDEEEQNPVNYLRRSAAQEEMDSIELERRLTAQSKKVSRWSELKMAVTAASHETVDSYVPEDMGEVVQRVIEREGTPEAVVDVPRPPRSDLPSPPSGLGQWLWFVYQPIYIVPLLCTVDNKPLCLLLSRRYTANETGQLATTPNGRTIQRVTKTEQASRILLRTHMPSLVCLDPSLVWLLRPEPAIHALAHSPEDALRDDNFRRRHQPDQRHAATVSTGALPSLISQITSARGPEIRIGSLIEAGYTIVNDRPSGRSRASKEWLYDNQRQRIVHTGEATGATSFTKHGFVFVHQSVVNTMSSEAGMGSMGRGLGREGSRNTKRPKPAFPPHTPASFFLAPDLIRPGIVVFRTPDGPWEYNYQYLPQCTYESVPRQLAYTKSMVEIANTTRVVVRAPHRQAVVLSRRRAGQRLFFSLSVEMVKGTGLLD